MKRLTHAERFVLENANGAWLTYRCPGHGVFQVPKTKPVQGTCTYSTCHEPVELIDNPAEYLTTH